MKNKTFTKTLAVLLAGVMIAQLTQPFTFAQEKSVDRDGVRAAACTLTSDTKEQVQELKKQYQEDVASREYTTARATLQKIDTIVEQNCSEETKEVVLKQEQNLCHEEVRKLRQESLRQTKLGNEEKANTFKEYAQELYSTNCNPEREESFTIRAYDADRVEQAKTNLKPEELKTKQEGDREEKAAAKEMNFSCKVNRKSEAIATRLAALEVNQIEALETRLVALKRNFQAEEPAYTVINNTQEMLAAYKQAVNERVQPTKNLLCGIVEEEPAKEEPAKEEPAKEEPAKEEPAKYKTYATEEPAKEEPAKEEPAKEEPAKEEPAPRR